MTARVDAVSPLLRRGLARAAEAAGFTVVAEHCPARVILRADGDERQSHATRPEMDVIIEAGLVVVNIRAAPNLAMVLRLQGLLSMLLDAEAPASG